MQYKKLYKQTKNGELAGHVQVKLPWIPEALGCSLVVERIIVGSSFSQLFEVERKPITEYPRIGILAPDWMRKTTGCLKEPEVPFFRFSKGFWNPG